MPMNSPIGDIMIKHEGFLTETLIPSYISYQTEWSLFNFLVSSAAVFVPEQVACHAWKGVGPATMHCCKHASPCDSE